MAGGFLCLMSSTSIIIPDMLDVSKLYQNCFAFRVNMWMILSESHLTLFLVPFQWQTLITCQDHPFLCQHPSVWQCLCYINVIKPQKSLYHRLFIVQTPFELSLMLAGNHICAQSSLTLPLCTVLFLYTTLLFLKSRIHTHTPPIIY